MQKNIFKSWLLLMIMIMTVAGCKKSGDQGYDIDLPTPPEEEQPTMYRGVFSVDSVADGLIHYKFQQYYEPQKANQSVNVLRLDLTNPNYKLQFVALSGYSDSMSSVARDNSAIAGVNGSFGKRFTFEKVDGKVIVPLKTPGGLHWWANEGAFFYNSQQDLKIAYGTKQDYESSTYNNITTGGAVLIDDYDPVGVTFIGNVSDIDIDTLDYSDYRRIMGVRHPRSVIALTDKYLFFVTIDGRASQAAGMSAKEATEFIAKYFNPRYAINMDGGGSAVLYVKGREPNGIVSYPSDNGRYDHYGQRMHYSFILIKKK